MMTGDEEIYRRPVATTRRAMVHVHSHKDGRAFCSEGQVVAKAVAPTMEWTCVLALSCVRNETRIEISIISSV